MTPPVRTVPDRCPGALRVHDAVDGGLVRVRVPGGFLTGAQVSALAALSAACGDGSVDLTSRGNLQLRGLRPGTADEVARVLVTSGLLPSLDHDIARNVVASPLTDLSAAVAELDEGLCASSSLARLPGRFLLALDDGSGDVLSLEPDAALQQGSLVLGGVLAGPGGVPDLLAAAEAFLAVRGDGKQWRVSELPGGAGSVAVALGRTLGAAAAVGRPPALGAHGSRVLALAPLGRLTPSMLVALSAGPVVVTPWRSVLVDAGTDLTGFVTDAASPWDGVTACAGTACASALGDVRADAARFLVPGTLPVHWSGCGRRCGLPKGEVLDLVATGDGWTMDGVRVADPLSALVGSRT
jgi:precorrin-3B synthase